MDAGSDDPGLVERVLAGDSNAFALLVTNHHAGVRHLFAGLRDATLAEALIQQTFINAYTSLGRFRRGADFGVWVRGIAHNLMRVELRRRGRESKLLRTYHQYLLDRAQGHESDEHSRQLHAEAVANCIEALPPLAQQAVRLRYEDGLNIPQVATTLQKSALATRQLLFRARLILKHCVEKRLGEA